MERLIRIMGEQRRYTIHLIAAARPNFMKIAPLYHVLKDREWADPVIVHTGQHYDLDMSDSFFQDLMLPSPHIHLGVGSGTHAEQTGKVMVAYEKILMDGNPSPDLIVVVGDVNSTVAATLAAVKLGVPTAHLEAGLRSFDRTMPEEINRVVTDSISDLLWTPSSDGDENLKREGAAEDKIERVGNIMIDSLEMMRSKIEKASVYKEMGIPKGGYAVITLHRPSNVDQKECLAPLVDVLTGMAKQLPVVFPIHPRTRERLNRFQLMDRLDSATGMHCLKPMGYVQFMNLIFNCQMVVTDSGGIQEETSYLGIPCLTLRDNTERPITISEGTNRLCNIGNVNAAIEACLSLPHRNYNPPELWDGKTAERVADNILRFLS